MVKLHLSRFRDQFSQQFVLNFVGNHPGWTSLDQPLELWFAKRISELPVRVRVKLAEPSWWISTPTRSRKSLNLWESQQTWLRMWSHPQIDGFNGLVKNSIRLENEYLLLFKRWILPTLFFDHEHLGSEYLGEIWQCDLLDQSFSVVFQRLCLSVYLLPQRTVIDDSSIG